MFELKTDDFEQQHRHTGSKYGSSWAQRVQEKEQPTANINKNTTEARTHTKKMKEDLTV